MSVELPFAPVDELIRRHAGDLRVSADAAAELAARIQSRGAALAADAAERAAADGRKTLMASDFGASTSASGTQDGESLDPDMVALPIAPVDRIARLDIDDRYRVAMDARIALARRLETYADEVATGAAVLARHAGRRTVQAEDVETYCRLRDLDAEFERGGGDRSDSGSGSDSASGSGSGSGSASPSDAIAEN